MKKRMLPVAFAGAALVAMLGLSGCGASLDRDVEVAGMTVSVPSNWEQKAASDNTEAAGTVSFERFSDDSDDPYTAIEIRYERVGEGSPANAEEAIALIRQEAEESLGATEWGIDEEKTEIIDGAQVTTYEYSFNKEIDRVSRTYEYKVAYVFAPEMVYGISVYGDDAAISDVVASIEL